jgi:hypothetical protein
VVWCAKLSTETNLLLLCFVHFLNVARHYIITRHLYGIQVKKPLKCAGTFKDESVNWMPLITEPIYLAVSLLHAPTSGEARSYLGDVLKGQG